MPEHEKINYVEFPSRDLGETKRFFECVFGWTFEDYGPDYTAFTGAGLNGGFHKAELRSVADKGGALIVLYSEDLADTQARIEAAGGAISVPVFEFPGGRRFHFREPSGNELAVWSDR